MIKENVKIMNWRNGFLLSLVSYILYLIIWLILDDETANQLPGMATVDYVVDFLLCMLFTYISLGFSYLVFKILPFRTSYVWVIVYASCLLTLNNLVAFGMTSLFNLLWDETGNGLLDELINMKRAYTFAMIATFISSVYNSFDYLLKPLDADELEAAIDKATKAGKNYADENLRQLFDSLQKNQFRYRERFLLPYRDGYKTVRVSDINHIETENKTVYLRLNNGTSEVVNMSMDELEQQLNPDCFFRANRQYIINIEYVLFLSNYFGGKLIVRLKGYPNTKITVSKEKAQRLKEWIDR